MFKNYITPFIVGALIVFFLIIFIYLIYTSIFNSDQEIKIVNYAILGAIVLSIGLIFMIVLLIFGRKMRAKLFKTESTVLPTVESIGVLAPVPSPPENLEISFAEDEKSRSRKFIPRSSRKYCSEKYPEDHRQPSTNTEHDPELIREMVNKKIDKKGFPEH
jgi:hypothetical protein